MESFSAVAVPRLVLHLGFDGRALPESGRWPVADGTMNRKLHETVGKYFIDWMVDKAPDFKRRIEHLPALLAEFGVDGIIAKANRKPSQILVSVLRGSGSTANVRALHGHDRPIRNRVIKEELRRDQLVDRRDALLGAKRPNHKILIGRVDHQHITREAGDGSSKLVKSDVLAITDKREDGVFHSLENRIYS